MIQVQNVSRCPCYYAIGENPASCVGASCLIRKGCTWYRKRGSARAECGYILHANTYRMEVWLVSLVSVMRVVPKMAGQVVQVVMGDACAAAAATSTSGRHPQRISY